jgi:hypothetical protein
MKQKTPVVLATIVILGGAWLVVSSLQTPSSKTGQKATETIVQQDNVELGELFMADKLAHPAGDRQIDERSTDGKDAERLERVRGILAGGRVRTANDYFRGASILHHGGSTADYVLAHEMAVAAMMRGEAQAKWLTAATEDRLLLSLGQPQRFGTQFKAGSEGSEPEFLKTDEGVSDRVRAAYGVPSINDGSQIAGGKRIKMTRNSVAMPTAAAL